tara:strand:- start:19 stop:738 length:720 start_codon:yes stop_codon:yes gene_type:complete
MDVRALGENLHGAEMWASGLTDVPDDVQEVVRTALVEMRRSREAYRSMKQRIASGTPSGSGRHRLSPTTRLGLDAKTEALEYARNAPLTNHMALRERSSRAIVSTTVEAALSRCRELESIYLDPNPKRHFFLEALLLDWLAIIPSLSSKEMALLLDTTSSNVRGAHMVTCYVYFVGFHDRYVEDEVLCLIQKNVHARKMINRRLFEEGAAWRATSRGAPPTLGEVVQLLERMNSKFQSS